MFFFSSFALRRDFLPLAEPAVELAASSGGALRYSLHIGLDFDYTIMTAVRYEADRAEGPASYPAKNSIQSKPSAAVAYHSHLVSWKNCWVVMPFIFLKKMKFWPFGGGELEMKIEQAQKTENVVPLALSLSCSMKTRVPVSTISERFFGFELCY